MIDIFNNIGNMIVSETIKKSPLVATVIGITGTVVTAILAVKATPGAMEDLEKLYSEKEEPTPFDVIKTAAPHYATTALSMGVTITAEIFSYKEMSQRYGTALMTCGILEEELLRRNEKIKEYLGVKKAQKMEEEIANDKRRQRSPVNDSTDIIFTGNGQNLCYDTLGGRYFRSDMQAIKTAINIFNDEFIEERDGNAFDDPPEKELNDLYMLLGIKKTGAGRLVTRTIISPHGIFASDIAENGEPCLTINLEPYAHMPSDY